ncbi:hypothetical protein DSCA_63670 [Desulfosarcina alkanivorans]|uniref:CYTH domain-containing protein n=1 Tax=Desulfosarcina alkanivorans TaxID=571177 RepID=A0A5K7Z7E8_9BACT|nr:class IV adenylate cyclase [Desulfosarcina alkanivorans]BBO72437.1 hypothetical protein DSCA_63670 [Desulfosarcina alkanivorans]
MDHIEIELKFHISDFDDLRGRFLDLGALCIRRQTLEINARYDTGDNRLLERHCLLRLRKDVGATLTFKSPPPTAGTRFKRFRELEVGVSDFDTMEAILNALGYRRRQTYEKWRETWQAEGVTLCLDTMPFGRFLEIEGEPDAIMLMVRDLGLQWDRRILYSYLGIFEVLREKEELPFRDVTFDNFKAVSIPFERHCHRFETGGTDGR